MRGGSNKESLEHAERVYANCIQKSQMVGLLVGRHLVFLYEDLARDYSPMNKFLSDIRTQAREQRKLYNLKKAEVESIYDLMRFCYRCSLIVCQNTVPKTGRILEINKTIDNKPNYIHCDDSKAHYITPWPFEKKEFSIEFEYRIVSEPSFKNPEELRESIKNAEVCLETFTFKESKKLE